MSRSAPQSRSVPHRVLAHGIAAPEGPVVAPGGWILNVCSFDRPDMPWSTRGGDITATHPQRPAETVVLFNTSTEHTRGIPAGLAFGPDGSLYVADEGRRAIIRVSPEALQDEFVTSLGDDRLNGPNDLSFDADGNLFFSDPWTSSPNNPVGCIYGFAWATGELIRIDSGMAFPNGVVVREDRVYVAETYSGKVWAYDLVGPGRAANRQQFCSLPALDVPTIHGPDGLAFDAEGNLFVACYEGAGVFVYDPRGKLVETIPTPGDRPTNACFGGSAHESLVVTVDDLGQLVIFELGATGAVLNFCPSQQADHAWRRVLPS